MNNRQWIPVDVGVPLITGQLVLTFCETDGINMGKYVGQGGFVVHLWDVNKKPQKVTHWMPLPEQPAEE